MSHTLQPDIEALRRLRMWHHRQYLDYTRKTRDKRATTGSQGTLGFHQDFAFWHRKQVEALSTVVPGKVEDDFKRFPT